MNRLTALLERVRADDHASYKSFRTPAELRGLIADDLALLLTERFALTQHGPAIGASAEQATESPVAGTGAGTELPTAFTSLLGRDAEIVAVSRALGEHRLVTLTGPGGVGKTRLGAADCRLRAGQLP